MRFYSRTNTFFLLAGICGVSFAMLGACTRQPEYTGEPHRTQPPSPQTPNQASGPAQPTSTAPVVLSPQQAVALQTQQEQETYAAFLQQDALSAAERGQLEPPISAAFSAKDGASILEPVECRKVSCRVVISAPDEERREVILAKAIGMPKPGHLGIGDPGPLGRYQVFVARRGKDSSGAATATLYLTPPKAAQP